MEGQSARFATLVGLRLLLLLLAAVALAALTALPLVRRTRALSKAMSTVVDEGFEGAVADDAGDAAPWKRMQPFAVRERHEYPASPSALLRQRSARLGS